MKLVIGEGVGHHVLLGKRRRKLERQHSAAPLVGPRVAVVHRVHRKISILQKRHLFPLVVLPGARQSFIVAVVTVQAARKENETYKQGHHSFSHTSRTINTRAY